MESLLRNRVRVWEELNPDDRGTAEELRHQIRVLTAELARVMEFAFLGMPMRYLKGSLDLKFQDRELLHLVADARYIKHSQLFQLSLLKTAEFRRPIFNWRVRRLVNGGLLRKMVIPQFGKTNALYSVTRGGVDALEWMGITYLGGGYVEQDKPPSEMQLCHVLELNDIRLALECSGMLHCWTPESFIRVLNLSPTLRYAKTYDAVVNVSLGEGIACDFAIEYERTLKSERRYESVVEAIASEKRLDIILYLTSSYEVASTLRSNLQRVQARIFLARVDSFKRDLLDTQVDVIGSYHRIPFRAALMEVACRLR